MSYRIIQARRNINNFLTFHAEAMPDGVNIMHHSNSGMIERVEAVSYIDAVNRLDAGDYDDKSDEGMSVYPAIVGGGNQGYFDYTSWHDVIIWRQLTAAIFMLEMREENGTVNIIDNTDSPSEAAIYSNGIVAMPLYPVAECLTMTSNIEDAMIKRFSIESGIKRVIIFYRTMMDVEQRVPTLSGHRTLAELRNGFIAELNENGMPAELVAHRGRNHDY